MAYEEKRAWIMLVVAACVYAGYLIIIFGRADSGVPLTEVRYVSTLLWTIGAAVVANIVLNILIAMVAPRDAGKADQRDRQIDRSGEYTGHGFVIAGGVVALGLAMAEVDHFWIANAIYLAFVLSAVLASAAKIVAYRRGSRPW